MRNSFKRGFAFMVIFLVTIATCTQFPHVSASSGESLEFTSLENIKILQDGSVDISFLINIPSSPLADIYRQALSVSAAAVEEKVPIPENAILTSTTKIGENVEFKELNTTETLVPVREKFYDAICQENDISLGLDTKILNSYVVPYGNDGGCRIYLEGCASPRFLNITESEDNDTWVIGFGQANSTTLAGYLIAKIAFIKILMEKLPGAQTYKSSSSIKINIPDNATLLNYDELAGLNWFVDLGGGSYLEASFSVEAMTLNETLYVTEQDITISAPELCKVLNDYKLFKVKYALSHRTNVDLTKANYKVDDDFSWSDSITLLEYTATEKVTDNGFYAELTAYFKLGLSWYIGWDPTVPIPYLYPLKWFEAWIKPEAFTNITVMAGVMTQYSLERSWTLFEKDFTYTVWIGTFPVVTDVNINVSAGLEVSISGKLSITTGAKAFGWLKAGVRWDSGSGWQKVYEKGFQIDYVEPSIKFEAHAEIKPSLTSRIAVLFYDVAGPFVEFVLYALGSVGMISSTIEFHIKVGLDVNAGVTFHEYLKKLLRLEDWSWPLLEIVFKEWIWTLRHDVAITYVEVSKSKVYAGEIIDIVVDVENQGNYEEKFDVSVYYNDTSISWEHIQLPSQSRVTLTFIWNTTGLLAGTYNIKAIASNVVGEEDTSDNIYIYSTVKILPTDLYITFKPGEFWYKTGETTTTSVQVKNLRSTKITIWLGANFRDPKGEISKYKPQIFINPSYATIDRGQTANFTVTWTPPSDVPVGQYQIALDCWKDSIFTQKYIDNIEWANVFYIYKLNVLTPTTSNPALAGNPTSPNDIIVSVEWIPQTLLDPFANNKPAFSVEIGQQLGRVESVDSLMSYLGIYTLRVTPPKQTAEGLYDLNVTVKFGNILDSVIEPKTIKYVIAPPTDPIQKGLAWLRTRQNTDGSWQSNVGVTSLAVLAFLNAGYDETDATVSKAINYILSNVKSDGSIYNSYPTYETSLAILPLVTTRNEAYKTIIENAKKWLVNTQWDENCLWGGVSKDSWYYGGWGYGGGQRPDLSNTQFALLALDAAGLPKEDPTWVKAQVFLHRCQNINFPITLNIEGVEYTVRPYNHYGGYDGGFIYLPGSSLAGDQKSYGSMTGAGIWSLLLSGVPKTDPRVVAAISWVRNHYTWDGNPGMPSSTSFQYYYYLSMSKALTMYGEPMIDGHDWYREMYDKIVSLQKPDGYWINPDGWAWEDIPELVTAYSILSLQTRMIAPPVQRLSYLTFILRSNCLLRIINPEGNAVGYNYQSMLGENNIPAAIYSGPFIEPQYIVIINPQAGTYRLELIGISEGPYELTIQGNYGEEVTDTFTFQGEIRPGELHGTDVIVTAIVGPIDVYANPPQFQEVIDNTPPSITIEEPPIGSTLHGEVTYIISAVDVGSGVSSVSLSIREADGGEGKPIGFEDLPATYNATIDRWTLTFNTLQISDGNYVIIVKAADNVGNIASVTAPYTIKNWTPATVKIEPETLNLKSKGKWVTAYIELPEGYNVSDINISSILLNGTIPVDVNAPTAIGDYDGDGVPDLMVKFNRTAVCQLILSKGVMVGNVTLTVSGKLANGIGFEGCDTIRVRMPGDINMDGKVDTKDISIICKAFGSFPNHPRWNPIADENEDNKIDIADIALTCRNFGKTYK
jgi:squalene-hopene/tetraprenyl-beta-curcumene cyclase